MDVLDFLVVTTFTPREICRAMTDGCGCLICRSDLWNIDFLLLLAIQRAEGYKKKHSRD